MTNTGWQQSSRVRRPMPYLAAGAPPTGVLDPIEEYDPEQDAPGYVDPMEQQVAQADAARMAQQGPVNDLPGMPVSPDQPVAAAPPDAPGHYDPEAGWMLDAPPPLVPDTGAGPVAPPEKKSAFAPMPGSDGFTTALQNREDIAAQRPVMGKPKWWERVAAGAAGGLAGFSNAAGRARPIDIPGMTQAIEHPGYQNRLEEWQSRMIPAEQRAEIEGQKAAAGWKSQEVAGQAALRDAQATQAMAHGQYWLSRSEQERNQWKIDPKTGILYNTVTRQTIQAAPTVKDRYQTAIALLSAANGGKPLSEEDKQQALEYSFNGKLSEHADRNPNEWALYLKANGGDSAAAIKAWQADKIAAAKAARRPTGGMTELQQINLDQRNNLNLDRIANKKNTDERSILDRHRIELSQTFDQNHMGTQAMGTPEGQKKIDEINGKYAHELQTMQDEFARQTRQWVPGTVDIPDVDITANPTTHKIEWNPRVAAPGTTGGQFKPRGAAPVAAAPFARPAVAPAPAAPVVPKPTVPVPAAAPAATPPAPGAASPPTVPAHTQPTAPTSGPIKMLAPDGHTVLTFINPEQRDAFIKLHNLVPK